MVSHDGLYPGLWSAEIAAEIVHHAMTGAHPQDELSRFGPLWRGRMGEYLRPPSTDITFLIPLVFRNRNMADRLAAAFWRGENL
jgi:hypothetical protein